MEAHPNNDWWRSEESIPDWALLGKSLKEEDVPKGVLTRPAVPLLRLAQLHQVVKDSRIPGWDLPPAPLDADCGDTDVEESARVNSFSPEEADRRERELKDMVTELQKGLREGKQSVEECLNACAMKTPEDSPRGDGRDDGQYKIFTPRPRVDSREAEISAKAALAWDFEEALLDPRPCGPVPADPIWSAREIPFRAEDMAKGEEDPRRNGGVCPTFVGQSIQDSGTQVQDARGKAEFDSCFRRASTNLFGKTRETFIRPDIISGSVRFNIYTPRELEVREGRKRGEPELPPCDELTLSQHSIFTPRQEDICLSARSMGSEVSRSALVCDFEDALVDLRGTCKRTPRAKVGELRSVGCLTPRDRRPPLTSRPDEAREKVGARTIATQTDDNAATDFKQAVRDLQDARIQRSETQPMPRICAPTSTPQGRVGNAEYSCPHTSAVCAHGIVVQALSANEEVSGTQFWTELKGAVRQDLTNLGKWAHAVAKERLDEKKCKGRWLKLLG